MVTDSKYAGKFFSILGDSVSALEGWIPGSCEPFYLGSVRYQAQVYNPEDIWWGQVIDTLGGRLLVNNSWSGTLVCRHPQCEIESYGASDSRTMGLKLGPLVPDVIMVFMGYNDFGWAIPPAPENRTAEGPVFETAYDAMLQKLRKFYPQAEIWCLTLPHSCQLGDPRFVPVTCRSGWHISDYCRAISAAAERNGCRVLDIRNPELPCDTIDGYHPNADGMATIANSVLAAVRNL